ncbi:MAG: type transport system permease protein [Gemmatimonadaceae bacterium]|nr:type transport system permease protein [Gemmatimonadaceae bacterium]
MRSTPVRAVSETEPSKANVWTHMTPVRGVSPGIVSDTSLNHLLSPKFISARARPLGKTENRAGRLILFFLVGGVFWTLVFGMLYRLLRYFRGIPEIGALLAGKLLAVMFVSLFGILILSNVVTALSSFFLAKDLDLLVAAPVDWLRLYGAKLLETTAHSSWMVVLIATPILTAYGISYHGGFLYPLVAVASMLPFLFIPAALGSAVTLLLVNIFPARRTRDILSVIAILAAAGVVLLFRLVRPERLARPEGFRSLVEFIALLRSPTSSWMPSEWAAQGIMGWLRQDPELLPFYMLWSTAAVAVVLGALLHRFLYARGFSKSQESGERWVRQGALGRLVGRMLTPWGVMRRELVLKEMRLFFRDTTQWSQLILLTVLVVVYVFNIKFLPLRGEGVTFFLQNVIPFVNLILAGFVLASIAARFIFPGVSLEGRTLWLLRSSPLEMEQLLWSKFWVGTLPLLVLALGLVFATDVLLQVSGFMMAVSIFTITMLTFAIAGLALGFGALFPKFNTENAAQIPTSFGGLVLMMASVALIGAVIAIEARPVYQYVGAHLLHSEPSIAGLWLGFGGASLICLAVTFVPIRIAVKRMKQLER